MARRAGDVLIALLLAVALAPVFVLVGLAVRLESPGPVLFRQPRVGREGRQFLIRKFRTMRAGTPGPEITAGGDPRVTRVGRIIRGLKLDELPQLWNVIAGDMSLVGPRPELPRFVELWPEAARRRVLSVRPGLTDLASLTFIDESEQLGRAPDPMRHYVDVLLPRKLELAVRYVEHRTLWLDVRILVATLTGVLGWHWIPNV